MLTLLLASQLALADGGIFSKIRYGIGVDLHAGVGAYTGQLAEAVPMAEALGFELRSYFSDRLGTQTILNLGRTGVDGLRKRARLDYDSFLALYVPRGHTDLVFAPGFSIAYTLDETKFARYGGGWRMGVDVHTRGRTSVGLYLRPFFAWMVRDAPELPDGRDAGLHIGALADVSIFWRVGKRWAERDDVSVAP